MFPLILIIILCAGLFTAYRLLWPEMYVKLNPPNFKFLWRKPHLRPDVSHTHVVVDAPSIDISKPIEDAPQEEFLSNSMDEKIDKLEVLLYEKNKIIDRLQSQLDSERSHRKEFDNVKAIMDEEIKHLREQLKAFRNYYKEKADA